MQRSTVYGWPISLLKLPGGATVSPARESTAAMRSFVDVLPADPVTPTMVSPCAAVSSRATADASLDMPATTPAAEPSGSFAARSELSPSRGGSFSTITEGLPTSFVVNDAAAPASAALSTKSCPSTRAPGKATKSPPGPILRESNSTNPVTCVPGSASGLKRPPVISAMRASVMSIMLEIAFL